MQVLNSLINWRKVLVLSACFVFIASSLESCKKKSSSFGNEALDPDALIASGGIDTFQLFTYSEVYDSATTQNVSYAILGNMHDPKVGIFKASFYSQFDYDGTLTTPAGPVVVDSVILGLKYVSDGAYGQLDAQTFEVYEVSEQLNYDSDYYHTTVTAVTGSDLVIPSSATQIPDLETDPIVEDTSTPPQLRLKLQNSFGQQMLDDWLAGNTAFSDHDEFKTYFKGLRVSSSSNPTKGNGGVVYIDINSDYSYLNIYYHLVGDTVSYVLNLARRSDCLFYNHVDVDHSGYHIAQVLADSTYGATQFYCQAFNTRAVVNVPSIDDLKKNTFIHQALLFLPIEFQTFTNYTPSYRYAVAYKDDNGSFLIVQAADYDDNLKGIAIDLTKYIQQITLGNYKNRPLYIFPYSTNSRSAERTIFNGSNTSYKAKPKMIIKYSEFK